MSLALLPDSEPLTNPNNGYMLSPHKFPHTRAQLAAFGRQYKASDSYESDAEGGDELAKVPSAFMNKVVALLVEEREEELKGLLKETYGIDEHTVEQNVLDLMHKHRDDVAGVPFLFLTPTRRPISRPSSRASMHSTRLHPARPDTPNSAPSSPLAHIFKRPPLTSPLATGPTVQATSYMTARSEYSASPTSSPILAHAHATHAHAQFTASLPASPLSSPRLLNAKASEFKPIPRPLSAASSNPGPARDTPSPDLWAHSPFRATSNLAIAAPLLPEQPGLTRSLTPSSSLRSSVRPDTEDSDEDDPFDPFGPNDVGPPMFNVAEFDNTQWPSLDNPATSNYHDMQQPQLDLYAMPYDSNGSYLDKDDEAEAFDAEDPTQAMLTDGMTPFDVLSSVFGSTLAPSELEEALAANSYDFERAIAWLVDRALPTQQPVIGPQNSPMRMQPMGGRVTLVPRDPTRGGGRGGYLPNNRPVQRFVNGRPAPSGNRVCRYFVAGECLRADCRFSHDLERALCRFWLRGTCAKGEQCEFLHHLPNVANPAVQGQVEALSVAMARASMGPGQPGQGQSFIGPQPNLAHEPPLDDFPVLGFNGNDKTRRGAYGDPGRTRFASAVKKPAPPQNSSSLGLSAMYPVGPGGGGGGGGGAPAASSISIIAPRPSPRLRLRPPTLLPTLPTGPVLNKIYMSYRTRALQLGAARNACLSRAADAWRRGDGAAAKRFSREGHELNAKMSAEMRRAAGDLVRKRAEEVEHAVRSRDLGGGWSDDPADRAAKGRLVGGGYGVCLGVAGTQIGDGKLSVEERTEVVLDLHGLHANEATEVLEEFLLALENEMFYGLAYVIVGEQKHTGTQDAARGAGRARLATGVREWIHRWGYPWSERDGIVCVDPLTHHEE